MTAATVQLAPRDIARMVSIPQVLQQIGWRIRPRGRADCGLCRGRGSGTVAYREHVWHCHRCHQGGNVYALVRAVQGCDFRAAMVYVAELAGIRLEGRPSADLRCQLAARKQLRARLEHCAEKLVAMERALLRERRERIHDAERKRLKVSERLAALARGEPERFRGEQEALWLTLQAAAMLLHADIPAYTLLSFGAPDQRARFVLHPELRDEMIADVRWAGYIRTADGKKVEALA
jgi:CHC2 zinc finger